MAKMMKEITDSTGQKKLVTPEEFEKMEKEGNGTESKKTCKVWVHGLGDFANVGSAYINTPVPTQISGFKGESFVEKMGHKFITFEGETEFTVPSGNIICWQVYEDTGEKEEEKEEPLDPRR